MNWKICLSLVALWGGGFLMGYGVREYQCEKQKTFLEKALTIQSGLHEAAALLHARELCKRGLR